AALCPSGATVDHQAQVADVREIRRAVQRDVVTRFGGQDSAAVTQFVTAVTSTVHGARPKSCYFMSDRGCIVAPLSEGEGGRVIGREEDPKDWQSGFDTGRQGIPKCSRIFWPRCNSMDLVAKIFSSLLYA